MDTELSVQNEREIYFRCVKHLTKTHAHLYESVVRSLSLIALTHTYIPNGGLGQKEEEEENRTK